MTKIGRAGDGAPSICKEMSLAISESKRSAGSVPKIGSMATASNPRRARHHQSNSMTPEGHETPFGIRRRSLDWSPPGGLEHVQQQPSRSSEEDVSTAAVIISQGGFKITQTVCFAAMRTFPHLTLTLIRRRPLPIPRRIPNEVEKTRSGESRFRTSGRGSQRRFHQPTA